MVLGGFLLFLIVLGGFWWFLVVLDGYWWFLVVLGRGELKWTKIQMSTYKWYRVIFL